MSTQSIYQHTPNSISDRIDETLIKFGGDYMMYSRFLVGEKPNASFMLILDRLRDAPCEKKCLVDCENEVLMQRINTLLLSKNINTIQ